MIRKSLLVGLCCSLFCGVSVYADLSEQIIEAEKTLGIDNSDLTVVERVAELERQLYITRELITCHAQLDHSSRRKRPLVTER